MEAGTGTHGERRSDGWTMPAAQVAAVAAFGLWLFVFRLPIGYPPEWAWTPAEAAKRMPFPWGALRVLVLCGGLAAVGAWSRSRLGWRRFGVLLALVGIVLFIVGTQTVLTMGAPGGVPMAVASQFSPISIEYFGTAYTMRDVGEELRAYPGHMRTAGFHVATHPPGAVLFYRLGIDAVRVSPWLRSALTRGIESSAGVSAEQIAEAARGYPAAAQLPGGAVPAAVLMTILPGVLGALTVFPLFLLVQRFSDTNRALLAAALFATTPSLLLFGQSLDQVVTLFATAALALGCAGVVQRDVRWLVVAGIVLGLGGFVSFGALAAGLVVVGFSALSGTAGEPKSAHARRTIGHAAALGLGVVIVMAAASLLCRVSLWDVFVTGMAAHRRATLGAERSHLVWAVMNWWELAAFLGWPLAVAVGLGVVRGCRRGVHPGMESPLLRLACAALLAMAVLDVLGVVRGEVGRIWLFLIPPLAGGAVYNEVGSRREVGGLLTAGLQIGAVLLAAVALMPVVRPY